MREREASWASKWESKSERATNQRGIKLPWQSRRAKIHSTRYARVSISRVSRNPCGGESFCSSSLSSISLSLSLSRSLVSSLAFRITQDNADRGSRWKDTGIWQNWSPASHQQISWPNQSVAWNYAQRVSSRSPVILYTRIIMMPL